MGSHVGKAARFQIMFFPNLARQNDGWLSWYCPLLRDLGGPRNSHSPYHGIQGSPWHTFLTLHVPTRGHHILHSSRLLNPQFLPPT
jgi:hypothetical protein